MATKNRRRVGIRSISDYSPFGTPLSGRTMSTKNYRFGFQGQEHDDEVKGAGNSVNYTFRMHDPRLGRFFAIDPLAFKYPYNSPYAFSENKVLHMIELEGLESTPPPLPGGVSRIDFNFPLGQRMEGESLEAEQLPLAPISSDRLFTFYYSSFGPDKMSSGYSVWRYNTDNGLWEGVIRRNLSYKPKIDKWVASINDGIPHGCVQNGIYLGKCHSITDATTGINHFQTDPNFPTCPIPIASYSTSDINSAYNAIVNSATNAASTTVGENSTTTATGITVLLNSSIFNSEDVKNMRTQLENTGRFVGRTLNVQLVPHGALSTLDSEGSPSEEVGGAVITTTNTKTEISNGNR